MAIIHIQEVSSEQVTEVIANNYKDAILAYAKNAAFKWADHIHTSVRYYENSDCVKRMSINFKTERLVVRHVYGNRYTVAWVEP